MYQQDPYADRQQTKFLMEKIHELEADVDRLIRHQNGNYLASTENFCLGYVGLDMGGGSNQTDNGTNRGWAWLNEPRGGYAEKYVGSKLVKLQTTGTRIHFYNLLQRPLFKGEQWGFFKDRLGQWIPVIPFSADEYIANNASDKVDYYREPNLIGQLATDIAAAEKSEDGTITVGKGRVRQMYYDYNTKTLEFENSGPSSDAFVEVHNTTSTPIVGVSEKKIIHAKLIGNKYFVDVDPCDVLQ